VKSERRNQGGLLEEVMSVYRGKLGVGVVDQRSEGRTVFRESGRLSPSPKTAAIVTAT
jgi:hypothetical protein